MKKSMSKVFCLLLAAVLMFGLVACSEAPVEPTVQNDPQLEKLIEEQGDAFIASFKEGFEGSAGGLKCELTLEVSGTELIFDCRIQDIDNVPDDAKAQMQEIYDQSKEGLKAELMALKEEAPNLSKVLLNVCEEDGDILAVIDIDF